MGEKPSLPFGKRIRQIRIDRGLSQRDLASEVGIDFTYLSKIENNRAAPPKDAVIQRIAQVLETDLEELFALAAKVSQENLRDVVAQDNRIGVLFRKLQSGELSEDQIREILKISGVTREGDDKAHR